MEQIEVGSILYLSLTAHARIESFFLIKKVHFDFSCLLREFLSIIAYLLKLNCPVVK
ncbi:MAG: hypothetical protein ACTSVI_09805 [Promethearchaeota archaeon]